MCCLARMMGRKTKILQQNPNPLANGPLEIIGSWAQFNGTRIKIFIGRVGGTNLHFCRARNLCGYFCSLTFTGFNYSLNLST